MKLIVGLGNPGAQYAQTRHNAGFMAIDRIVARHVLGPAKTKFQSFVYEGRVKDQTVVLLKPSTFMNRSGQAVGEAVRFYKLGLEDLLVAVDDTALPVGAVRLKASGSAGGHNGLTDIERALGANGYPRLRIGIGAPVINDRRIVLSDYVLGPFTAEQRPAIESGLDTAADAIESWIERGIGPTMNRFNTKASADAE